MDARANRTRLDVVRPSEERRVHRMMHRRGVLLINGRPADYALEMPSEAMTHLRTLLEMGAQYGRNVFDTMVIDGQVKLALLPLLDENKTRDGKTVIGIRGREALLHVYDVALRCANVAQLIHWLDNQRSHALGTSPELFDLRRGTPRKPDGKQMGLYHLWQQMIILCRIVKSRYSDQTEGAAENLRAQIIEKQCRKLVRAEYRKYTVPAIGRPRSGTHPPAKSRQEMRAWRVKSRKLHPKK